MATQGIFGAYAGGMIRHESCKPEPSTPPMPIEAYSGTVTPGTLSMIHRTPPTGPEGLPTIGTGRIVHRSDSLADIGGSGGTTTVERVRFIRRTGEIVARIPTVPRPDRSMGSVDPLAALFADPVKSTPDPRSNIHTVEPFNPKDFRCSPFDADDIAAVWAAFPQYDIFAAILFGVRAALRRSGIPGFVPGAGDIDTGYADCLASVRYALIVEFGPFPHYPDIRIVRTMVRRRVADWQRYTIHQRRGGFPYARYVNRPDGTVKRIRPTASATSIRSEYRGNADPEEMTDRADRIDRAGADREHMRARFYDRVYDRLTPTEQEIVGLYLTGRTIRDIARIMDTDESTTGKRIGTMIRKARILANN